jgi:hypothetical protein
MLTPERLDRDSITRAAVPDDRQLFARWLAIRHDLTLPGRHHVTSAEALSDADNPSFHAAASLFGSLP